jgi:charged multivesicular body protein 6
LQEIAELLSNNLTADEEDAVQDELRQLQADVVCLHQLQHGPANNSTQLQEERADAVELPSVPTTRPIAADSVPAQDKIVAPESGRERVPLAA